MRQFAREPSVFVPVHKTSSRRPLLKLDFEELLIGREVPEFIGVGMPVSGFRVSAPERS